MNVAIFWDIAPCRPYVKINSIFRAKISRARSQHVADGLINLLKLIDLERGLHKWRSMDACTCRQQGGFVSISIFLMIQKIGQKQHQRSVAVFNI
jgi:hypothetical protein